MLHHGNSGYSVTDSGAGERSVSSNYARHCSQERRHRCGFFCLGPLAFHSSAVGDHLSLNRQCTLAHRLECTFNHGLAFSSRPVRVGEVVRLKVKKRVGHWNGALRLGFTNRPPGGRALPPPPMAIPNLTDAGGHWAHPVPEPFCYTGSVLEFWVSQGGTIYCRTMNFKRFKLLKGVDLSRPLWAMFDIYGQTYGEDNADLEDLCQKDKSCVCYLKKKASPESSEVCVACMEQPASTTLLCGHRCLCHQCTVRVIQEFGTCPLCRQAI